MLSHQLTIALRLAAIVAQCMLAVHCSPSAPWGLDESDCTKVHAHLVATGFSNAYLTVRSRRFTWVTNLLAPLLAKDGCTSDTIMVSDLERVCKISEHTNELGNEVQEYLRRCGTIDYWVGVMTVAKNRNQYASSAVGSFLTPTILQILGRRTTDAEDVIVLTRDDKKMILDEFKGVYGNANAKNSLIEACQNFYNGYYAFMKSAIPALSFYDGSRNLQTQGDTSRLHVVKQEALRFQICENIVSHSNS